MNANVQYQQCPICTRTYQVYSHYCGDQSKCPRCRDAEKQAVEREDTPDQERRRREHFGYYSAPNPIRSFLDGVSL